MAWAPTTPSRRPWLVPAELAHHVLSVHWRLLGFNLAHAVLHPKSRELLQGCILTVDLARFVGAAPDTMPTCLLLPPPPPLFSLLLGGVL